MGKELMKRFGFRSSLRPFSVWLSTGLLLLAAHPAEALYSFQTTLSGGYYRERTQRARFPLFLNWTLNHSAASGIETNADLGVQNTFVPHTWGFRLYQAFVSVPLARNADLPSYRQPQLMGGRQFLFEGFEFATMDGAQVVYPFSRSAGVLVYAGMLRNLEDENLALDAKVAGGSAYGELAGFRYRAGYLHKQNTVAVANFGHGTLLREWELPGRPLTLAKGQWGLSDGRLDQAIAEVQVNPTDDVAASLEYTTRQPRALDAGDTLFIYRLFAISTQEQIGTRISWRLNPDLRWEAGVQRLSYRSPAGPETSYQEEASFSYRRERDTWSPGILHLKSYGGSLYQLGLRYVRMVSVLTRLHAEAEVARVNKVNRIQSWAYHGRGGVSFQLGPRFLARLLLECERNHIFKIDARAVAYVSHFLY